MARLVIAAGILLMALPAMAQVNCVDVQVECILNDLGGGDYEYRFTVINANTEDSAVFFWTLDNPNIPAEWETIQWTLPTGWTGSHPGQQLHLFASDNGDGNPYRIYSPTAAACGSGSYAFSWEFTNNGGPDPACDFGNFDYTFHMQGVNPATCANVGSSYTCPGTVPVLNMSWSTLRALYSE